MLETSKKIEYWQIYNMVSQQCTKLRPTEMLTTIQNDKVDTFAPLFCAYICIFLQKEIGPKPARKLLLKLTIGWACQTGGPRAACCPISSSLQPAVNFSNIKIVILNKYIFKILL